MSDPSVYVDPAALPWRDTPCAGVQWKKLRFEGGESTVLLRFAPGARYSRHRHPRGEQYLVISGALQDGGRTWGQGAYVFHPPGSVHQPSSAEGCLLFVTLPAPIEIVE